MQIRIVFHDKCMQLHAIAKLVVSLLFLLNSILCLFLSIVETIIHEILRQFPVENILYICVSIDYSEMYLSSRQIYIQIILTKVINKIGWFLDEVTGNQKQKKKKMTPYTYL